MFSAYSFQQLFRFNSVNIFFAAILLVTGCATNVPTSSDQAISSATSRGDADKLLVVDCLLPGQIRKLGQQLTFLTPRRPVKTTAADCEIRGGEYVAYDRANYATALKIWLPQAQAGDPMAQTYVGEIYEQGLGLTPDYTLAAQWYRKAADQGYSRAQINLGFLYEQGLGVQKDPVMALNLYRQASGLTSDQLAFTTSIQKLETERQALRQEVALRQQESADLRKQLQRTEQEREARRNRVASLQKELEQTRRQLQQGKSTSGTSSLGSAEISTLERRLAEQQAKLEQQRQEMVSLQQQAERQQAQLSAELKASQRKEEKLSQDLASRSREVESLQQQVANLNQQLESRHQNLESAKQEVEKTRRELQQLRNTSSTPDSATIVLLQERLAEQEALLGQQRQEMDTLFEEANEQQAQLINELQAAQRKAEELQGDVNYQARERESLQQQVDYLQRQLVAYQDQLNAREQELKEQQLSIQQAQRELDQRLRSAQSQNSAELKNLEQRFKERNQELAKAKEQISKLQANIKTRTAELETLKAGQAQVALRQIESAVNENKKTGPPSQPVRLDFGRYYALVIGNNQYTNFPNLTTAANDAQAIAKVLKERYGFSTRVLLNADRYSLLSALNEFRERLTEKDNFLLYYAGHGELDRNNGRGFWLPVDAEPNSTANWVADMQITDILNAMTAKHVMVIADSCYSGTMTRSVTTSIEGGRSEDKQNQWLELMIETRSRTVLTSGSLKPVLDTGGGNHSLFAQVLLEVLRDNQEILEGPLLYQRIANQVKAAAARLNFEQDPQYAPIRYAGDLGAPFFFAPTDRLTHYIDTLDFTKFFASNDTWPLVTSVLPLEVF